MAIAAQASRRLNAEEQRHLVRRLAFGGTREILARTANRPAEDVLKALLSDVSSSPPLLLVGGSTWVNTALRLPGMTDEAYDVLRARQMRTNHEQVHLLRQAWLDALLLTGSALRENMALFLHGLLGASASVVEIAPALDGTLQLIRSHALGRFSDLLEALIVDAGMMLQIGMDEHRRIRVSDRPAKLVLDFWTVGAGQYTNDDVEQLSRALTGWTLEGPAGKVVDQRAPRVARRTGVTPTFHPQDFDGGRKTILGSSDTFDARSAIRLLSRHPATARRIGRELLRHIGVETPSPALESSVAAAYSATDGSIVAMLVASITSAEFWALENRWTQVKSPIHLAAAACRQLEMRTAPIDAVALWLSVAGQTLFETAPNAEGGWPGGRTWLTPAEKLTVRYQLPRVLAGVSPSYGLTPAAAGDKSRARIMVGPAVQRMTVPDLVACLDAAPGMNSRDLVRRVRRSANAQHDAIRSVMMTPHYQLA